MNNRGNVGVPKKKAKGPQRFVSFIVLSVNVLLIAAAFMFYAFYTKAYDEILLTENLGNIANMNHSASTNTTSLFEGWDITLNDIAQYAERHDFTKLEALTMISDTNSTANRYFELIGSDYTGNLARQNDDGTFPVLNYSNESYSSLHKVFDEEVSSIEDEICFAPEFTDGGESATKVFAVYKHITLKSDDGQDERYTLMLATESKELLAILNDQSDFSGQSTVLIDASGNYIVSNQDFKSSNFFEYLYVYNDLTLDEKKEIKREMLDNSSGELYYKNASVVVEDCVYRYEKMSSNGWYCVTCVPLSSFRAPEFNVTYLIYIFVTLGIMFAIDMVWMQSMNSRLRFSIQREKEASAAKGNFMSRMSHEIRTPLNAVIGYTTIAHNEIADAKTEAERRQADMKVLDCLTKCDIASKHLLTIINDVLDMSAIESGKMIVAQDRFDFKGLITSLTTVFYSQAKTKGVTFEVVFDTLTEEWFVGDQMRTNQILTNLLSNAVKFTPEGGTVRLSIHQPEAKTNAPHIHFEVQDTGIGMASEYLSHIWTPFEQADSSISRRFGGTGLGLSITKNLVDLMCGTITVESELGVGTKFCVDLTFTKTEQPEKDSAYDFSAINALVVDDDPGTCEYIRSLFSRCGARCATVTSGEDALIAYGDAQKSGEPFTMCLVDWQMPVMDGVETIRRLHEISNDSLPSIVLTAYDYTELADEAADIGVDRFVSKPLFQSTLFDLLANISGKETQDKKIDKNAKYDFRGARVLLAEDNVMNMEIAKKIMESAGLIVDSAWNGKEAVDMFTKSAEDTYKVILMDVHMPEMNGHDAARAIRASNHPRAKTIPIIAMTADAFAENVVEALAAGMNDHISKPIDVNLLFEVLKRSMK